MVLKTRRWGEPGAHAVVCIHGVALHGGVFDGLGRQLAERGHSVVAVDLRGHGDSGREPPWNVDTHVADLLETLDELGVERASWVGHSFGGLLAATVATRAGERTERVALLDPGIEVPAARALRSAEMERLDWSFATVEGATNALLSNEAMVAPPHDVIADFVKDDVRKGPDGRFRFRFCPSAAVVAWSEVTLPAPPIASVPTLAVLAEVPLVDGAGLEARYREALGDLLTVVTVPNGHNLLWESPAETIAAIEEFLGPSSQLRTPPIPGPLSQ
ncbi:MAG TPA: alpha/beta hydrolase [Solirubrobacterales bacterium]|nr:alpha/beta hydrolase [Solirubrobacterales bacterium]